MIPYIRLDYNELDDDDAFNKRFEVIRGEILAGNSNSELKREARSYLLHALNTGRISRHNYTTILHDMDLA
jgi:hypothetical protein